MYSKNDNNTLTHASSVLLNYLLVYQKVFFISATFSLQFSHTQICSRFHQNFMRNCFASCRHLLKNQIQPKTVITEKLYVHKSEICGLVGSQSKGCGFKPHRYTKCNWCQSHTGLINAPSLVLPRCFK